MPKSPRYRNFLRTTTEGALLDSSRVLKQTQLERSVRSKQQTTTNRKTMKKYLSILALAALTGALPQTCPATPVTFWFSGTVNSIYNPSNAVPADINIGTPFTGRITYDPAWMSFSNANSFPAGDTLDTYYTNTVGFSMLVQIGGHTITNAPNPDGYTCGYVGVYDQFNNSDSLTLETGNAAIIVDGSSTRVGNQIPVLNLYLQDAGKTVFSSASLPTSAPPQANFPAKRNSVG
jgi:hypothetical protein